MKFFHKIHIHPLTYSIILISLFGGLFKYLISIFIILIIHEIGHIITMILFKRNIISINFLPVGGLIKIDAPISSNIYEDLLIAISGIGMQVIFGILIMILFRFNIISENIFQILKNYNIMIISFNLLPISPLDGYKIFKLLIEIIISYKKSFLIGLFISIITFIIMILLKYELIKENGLVFIFLVYMVIEEFKNRKYLLNRFYLERVLKDFKFNKISYIKNEEYMYKNRLHIINGKDEKEYLQDKFYVNKL